MKRLFICAIAIASIAACKSKDKPAEEPKPQGPLTASKNPVELNVAFAKVLDNYFHLKDNFITESDTLVNVYAVRMQKEIDSVNFNVMKADSQIVQTAQSFAQSISADLKGLVGEKDLEAKRKAFQNVNNNLYTLIQTIKYDQQKIYHQFCPMAFDNAGGNWLSNSASIRNPYLPKKMLTCGEVTDSLDFAK